MCYVVMSFIDFLILVFGIRDLKLFLGVCYNMLNV